MSDDEKRFSMSRAERIAMRELNARITALMNERNGLVVDIGERLGFKPEDLSDARMTESELIIPVKQPKKASMAQDEAAAAVAESLVAAAAAAQEPAAEPPQEPQA